MLGEQDINSGAEKTQLIRIWNQLFGDTENFYISGPITGIESWQLPFLDCKATLDDTKKLIGAYFVRAFITSPTDLPAFQARKYYMDKCLRMVLDCDTIILLPDWQRSAGVRTELEVALSTEKRVVYWSDYTSYALRQGYKDMAQKVQI